MSDIVAGAVRKLNEKLDASDLDGTVKFVIEDEGSVLIDGDGARAGDGAADCTMTASAETFQAILDGDLDPTGAFMSGRLSVDGDMGLAMKLASAIA